MLSLHRVLILIFYYKSKWTYIKIIGNQNKYKLYQYWFPIMVRVTGFEPAVSWSQTRRDTKLRYTQINFQLWSNMWSGKFYHK